MSKAAAILLLASTLRAQQQEPKPMDPALKPTFEVATIRPANPDDKNNGFHTEGTRLFYENETVNDMLLLAYGINHKQILNAPDWFAHERFDIHGAADQPGIPSVEQQAGMLRTLLEERFALKLHHEKRDMTRILITVAPGGPKLTPTVSKDFLPDMTCNGSTATRDCRFTSVSMDLFAETLRFFLDNPIVDETHITGRYDFRLRWAREDAPATTADDKDAAPSLYTAMPEQLGLKAESSKGPTDVLVIDHAQKPNDN